MFVRAGEIFCRLMAWILRLVHRNVIPMGITWEASHGMGWDTTHLYFP